MALICGVIGIIYALALLGTLRSICDYVKICSEKLTRIEELQSWGKPPPPPSSQTAKP